MRPWPRKRSWASLALASLLAGATPASANATSSTPERLALLQAFRFDEARASASTPADRHQVATYVAFYRGELETLAELWSQSPLPPTAPLQPAIASALDFAKATTCSEPPRPSPLATTICAHPVDAPLVAAAHELLTPAFVDIKQALGCRLPGVRIEVASSWPEFAELTNLAETQLRGSSTVGIARFGKIVLLSPRVTPEGFRWADTLAHEFTHLCLAEATYDRLPLWWQEGLAGYFERSWLGPPGAKALFAAQARLAAAWRTRPALDLSRVTSFVELAPGDNEVAYAQAYSQVVYLLQRLSPARLAPLLATLRLGPATDATLLTALGHGPTWQSGWRQWVLASVASATASSGSVQDFGAQDALPAPPPRAQRLAALLLARGHERAAYAEALSATERPRPLALELLLAELELRLGRSAAAYQRLLPHLAALYEQPGLAAPLAASALELGDLALARVAFEAALSRNPFEPRVRCGLSAVYRYLGHPKASREAEACQSLQR